MNPTAPATTHPFRTYTTTLAVLNVCLILGAVLLVVAAIVFSLGSYVFNDSGSVPQSVAPMVHLFFLDAFLAIVLCVWQFITRKHLLAMLPKARISMLALGITYVVIAAINLFQLFPILSLPPAAIGIWWIVVFSRSSTRAAFETPQLPPTSTPAP
jgi:hypothetical protein